MAKIKLEFKDEKESDVEIKSKSFLIGRAKATISMYGAVIPVEYDMSKVKRVTIDYD